MVSGEELVVDARDGVIRVIGRDVSASRLGADPGGLGCSEISLLKRLLTHSTLPESSTYWVTVSAPQIPDVVNIAPVREITKERVKRTDETQQ